MIDIHKWLDRVDNLLDVQKQLCIEAISTNFTRRELIELKILLNTLDDVESEFLKCDKVHYNLQDILCVINKLKAGGENEQSI